jgi:crotonobetainyl-CoA:carnitine CoA-transferase CaiB-like acyl-CoA transferase
VNSDDEWVRFCKVVNPSLAANDRFRTVSSRWRNQDELDKLVEQWTSQYDHHTAFHKLQAAGIAAAPVLSNKELYSDPHYDARGFFEEVTHPETGTHRYPGLPWKLSKTPGRIRMPAPYFGQHNEYIFRELLGLPEDELEALAREQIIGTTPLVDIDET